MKRGRNVFSAATSWELLCALSRSPTPEGMAHAPWNPRLVYLANHMNGERTYDAVPCHKDGGFLFDPEATAVPGQPPKGWQGYQQQGARNFAWISGSSGAQLDAYRQPGGLSWILHFSGAEPTGRLMESTYLLGFLQAAEGDIAVVERAAPGLLTALFRDRIAREPEKADAYRKMAQRIQAEI